MPRDQATLGDQMCTQAMLRCFRTVALFAGPLMAFPAAAQLSKVRVCDSSGANCALVDAGGTLKAGGAVTGTVTANQGTAGAGAWPVDASGATVPVSLDRVGGTAVLTGGVAGAVGIGGLAADGAAVTGNPVLIGGTAIADGAVTATTAGNVYRLPEDTQRRLLVRDYHPNFASWSTGAAAVTANTQIAGLSGAGLSYYITDLMISNVGASGSATTAAIVSSTTAGNACATAPASVLPPVAFPLNGTVMAALKTPIKVASNSALCCVIDAAATFTCQLSGFVAP